jgi:tetratricopeptide (TPR) repeat protein
VRPVQGYRPDSFLKEEPAVVELQSAEISSGNQAGLTDGALAKFIDYIREVGEGRAVLVAGGDDAPLKAAAAKIKRVALDLYNNTQYEQAISIYSAFIGYFPEDYEALFNTGFCHRELGNYKESEVMFMRIIELFYDNAYAWYNLSMIYSITTEGDKEAYCLQRAREFGYAVDVNRLSRLMVTYAPKNPFDA